MSQHEHLPVKEIKPLPGMVSVPISMHIQDVCDAIKAGGTVDPVSVAKVGGEMYAIAHIDTLFAYREIGEETMPCTVIEFMTLKEAEFAHLRSSIYFPVNPFRYGQMADRQRENPDDNYPTGLDIELLHMYHLDMLPEVKQRLSEYIDELGGRIRHIPSFFHVSKAISKLVPEVQLNIMETIIGYCDRMSSINNVYTVPDPNNVANMIAQSNKRKNKSKEEEKEKVVKNDMEVELEEGVPGFYHDPDTNNIDFRCECAAEYIVNMKNRSIRKREENKDMVVLSGEYGEPIYSMSKDIVEYFGMDSKPTLYYYKPDEQDHGDKTLLVKNRLTQDEQDIVWGVVGQGLDAEHLEAIKKIVFQKKVALKLARR